MRPLFSRLLACFGCLLALSMLACRTGPGVAMPLTDDPPAPAQPTRRAHPPILLTASDGTSLVLTSLRARAVLEEPLALTELELTFQNPLYEQTEGQLEILLPPGARVTRFAMYGYGGWKEAEVVGKEEAREVYETLLLEERDPAILERDTGNRFRGRVFPIEPHQEEQVRITYVQTLPDPQQPYRLGLRELPWLRQLDATVMLIDPEGRRPPYEIEHHLSHEVPRADLVIARDALPHDGVRQGERVLARVQPLLGVDPGEASSIRELTVLVDTSASQALDFDEGLRALTGVLRALTAHAGTAHLRVLAFDQEVAPIYDGPLIGFGGSGLSALLARRPLGASDLGRALATLEGGEHQRVLLVSDGLVSAGELSEAALRRQVAALSGAGVERIDALVLGRVRDESRLRRLVSGALPRSGVVVDPLVLSPERVAERLVQPTFDGLRVEVPGARWWSPTRLDGMQPGDAIMLYTELPESQPLRVQVSGPVHHEVQVPLRESSSALVDHEWRQGQIEGLVTRMAALQDALESERLRRHVVELSVRHRVFNDFTAFLVLDTDEDYARFGLDRRGLAEILVVGESGVQVVDRTVPDEPEPEPEPMYDAPDEYEVDLLVDEDRSRRRRSLRRSRRSRRMEYNLDGGGDGAMRGDEDDVVYDFDAPASPPPPATTTPSFGPPPVLAPPADYEPEPTQTIEPPQDQLEVVVEGEGEIADEPVTEATVSRTISTEEFRNIPVGNSTSRDFTQVVDTTVAVSRDAAEISLAGTTGAENKYTVEGVNINNPSFGTVGSTIIQEYVQTLGPHRPSLATVKVRGVKMGGERSSRRLRRAVHGQLEPIERCYFRTLAFGDSSERGRVTVELRTNSDGRVVSAHKLDQVRLWSQPLMRCLEAALLQWRLPASGSTITFTLVFHHNDGPPSDAWSEEPIPEPAPPPTREQTYDEVQALLAGTNFARALPIAATWRERDAVDLLALTSLGDAALARGDVRLAARAYGSIIDLYPSRADMRRFAAANLEAMGDPEALALAIDTYQHALADRPDHPSGHRNLAYALLRQGRAEDAFETLERALRRPFHPRFSEVRRVLADDLGLVAAVWRRMEPTRSSTIRERLAALGVPMATQPTLRITATWETDANDVDLHVQAGARGQAYSQDPTLEGGGGLVADVNAGFGPEHVIVPVAPDAFPCTISVHYYDRGPMGHGLGKVQLLYHDGQGNLRLDDRPFVAVSDDAWLHLGVLTLEELEALPEVAPSRPSFELAPETPESAPKPPIGNRLASF